MYNNGRMQDELQEAADEVARLLGASVTLEDRSFHLLAYGAQHGAIDTVRQESILRRRARDEVREYYEGFGIATARGPVRVPADAELGVLARVCVPLRHGGVTYGYLWLLDPDDPGRGRPDHRDRADRADLTEHGDHAHLAGQPARPARPGRGAPPARAFTDETLAAVAPVAARAAAVLAREARSRRDLGDHLPRLFAADPDERAAALHLLDVRGPVAAVAVRGGDERAAALWTLPRGVLVQPGPTVALLAPAAQAREVAARVQAGYGTAAGIGATRDDPGEAWQSWREALHALRAAERVPGLGPVAHWRDLGAYRLLVRLTAGELRELAAETGELPADPELFRTVESYLDHAGHAQRTAAALGVHRQTLYYRLGKAERLTGHDLSDGDDRLVLHLGLKAAHLLP
jgi:hypothetical protein